MSPTIHNAVSLAVSVTLKSRSKRNLRDHASAILKCIADDMEAPQAPVEEEAKSKGEQPSGPIERTAAVHVSLRIESGFDLVQIMAEYRALRSCVLRMWRYPDSFAGGAEEITRFAEAIDQNVAEASLLP